MDDDDEQRVPELVADVQVVPIIGRHDLHMALPDRYGKELVRFAGGLRLRGRLPRGR